jgi:hypothetical protein
LTRMFETVSAWIVSSLCLTSFLSISPLILIVITSKYIIVVSDLLELSFVSLLFKLFFLVPVWINTYVAMLLSFLFKWIASFLEWLLLHLIVVVKVLWRFVVVILWDLTLNNLLLSHSRMSLIIRIMLVLVILLRLSMLLRSVVWNSVWNLRLRLLLLLADLLLLELWCHLVSVWNGRLGLCHTDNCWNLSFILRWSLIWRLRLALVIIIISISINALWRLGKIVIMAMRILIISASSRLSGTKLLITLIKLLCHWLINGLSNCIVLWVTIVVVAHKIMIIHIFLNASWWSTWVFDITLVDVLDLLNVSLNHIEISRFELFSFLKKTGLLNVS